MIKNGMRPVHPGEILFEEFMKPSDPPINANMLAKVRLAAFFNTTAEFWMNLQKTYELRLAERALSSKVRKHIEQHRDALVPA
jgi:antitoxin HigA-1